MSTTRKYTLEGLDCANCAMKIEEAIAKLNGVENVSIVFATKTLSLKSILDEHELFNTIKKTIDSVEDGVTLIEKTKSHHEHHHDDDEHCGCGHEHHEHNHSHGKTRKYTLQDLDCAHCAMKIEEAIAGLDGVDNVIVTFATKTLALESNLEEKELFDTLQKTIDSVEDGVTLIEQKTKNKHSHGKTRKYTLQDLDCANCAMKIEEAIAGLDGVDNVIVTFATKTLALESSLDEKELFDTLQKTIDSVEDGVTLIEQKDNKKIHSEKKSFNKDKLILIETGIAIVLTAIGLAVSAFISPEWIGKIIIAVGVCFSGYRVVIKGLKTLVKLRLDENVLMMIAVVASCILGEFFEAAAVTILFNIGEYIEDKAVNKSRKGIEALSMIRPDKAHLLKSDGTTLTIDAEEIEPDDTIIVNPYERIPLDGVIIDGESSLDTSALTGESVPRNVAKNSDVMSGMMNLEGVLTIKVTNSCEDSAASRILKLVEESSAQKGNSEKFISRFAKVYTPIVFLMALVLAIVPPLIGLGDFTTFINRALVFLVASCPCALVISVPLGFYSGIGSASKNGVLIKGGKFIEAISKVNTVAFDKTGTLTKGELAVANVKLLGKMSEDEVLTIAASAEEYSSHPSALAIKKAAEKLPKVTLTDHKEIAGKGVSAQYNGKAVLCGNRKLFNDSNLKSGIIYLSVDGKIVGEIETSDEIREDTKATLDNLKYLGIKHIVMLTGDGEIAAKKIADECGLSEFKHSLMPEEKAETVKELQKNGKVIFVGDGINDAPVLAAADCGFAMGLGSDAAIESADAVLTSGTLAKLPTAIKISRSAMKTVRFNIAFALALKAIVLILAAFGYAPMWIAVIADTGLSVLTVLNAARLLRKKY